MMDEGLGGGFITIFGGNLGKYIKNYAIVSKNPDEGGFTFDIKRGQIYRFKYRSQNAIGWS